MGGRRDGGRGAADGWWRAVRSPVVLPRDGWRDHGGRSRVLVECEDESMIWAMERMLTDAGYDAAACVGPSPEATCALDATGACDLQAGADVVVNCFGSDDVSADIAAATRGAYPGTPLIVSVRAQIPAGSDPATVVLAEPWTKASLLAAVEAAVGPALATTSPPS